MKIAPSKEDWIITFQFHINRAHRGRRNRMQIFLFDLFSISQDIKKLFLLTSDTNYTIRNLTLKKIEEFDPSSTLILGKEEKWFIFSRRFSEAQCGQKNKEGGKKIQGRQIDIAKKHQLKQQKKPKVIKKGGGSRAQFMLSGECAKNSDNYFRAYVSWGCYKLRLMVNEKG